MKEWQTPEVTEIELEPDEDVLQPCLMPSLVLFAPCGGQYVGNGCP